MTKPTQQTSDGEIVAYAGGEGFEPISGWSGQLLTLQGATPVLQEWAPKSKRVHDLEIRVRVLDTTAALGVIPIIRVYAEISAGKNVYREPRQPNALNAGTAILDATVPARGLTWRVNARRVRMQLYIGGSISGAAVPSATVLVSIQPTRGSQVPVLPTQQLFFPTALSRIGFPMTANEWKLFDANGQPLVALAVSVVPVGLCNALFGPIDGALLADWRPIPHDATSYQCSAAHYVSFR